MPTSLLAVILYLTSSFQIFMPQLSPQLGDIPRSNFQFDFEFERKVLAEAEKETPSWSKLGLESLPSKTTESTSSLFTLGMEVELVIEHMGSIFRLGYLGPTVDPVVSRYVASGLNREAVSLAVANYGDNPTKVQAFVNGYTLLREMGFSSNKVTEALLMYDNDTDKALAHFLNSSS
ncbi:uncharacterized protein LOC110616558 [Manihot esculenta]|uniref:uncharacterized protein LOC110616558 n=1 Tax=Manihot esculenta TaxID=3983 RepID=UPI001CC59E8F|nr:uncharacterized protein LOC110616558 [Manihot esculenta]